MGGGAGAGLGHRHPRIGENGGAVDHDVAHHEPPDETLGLGVEGAGQRRAEHQHLGAPRAARGGHRRLHHLARNGVLGQRQTPLRGRLVVVQPKLHERLGLAAGQQGRDDRERLRGVPRLEVEVASAPALLIPEHEEVLPILGVCQRDPGADQPRLDAHARGAQPDAVLGADGDRGILSSGDLGGDNRERSVAGLHHPTAQHVGQLVQQTCQVAIPLDLGQIERAGGGDRDTRSVGDRLGSGDRGAGLDGELLDGAQLVGVGAEEIPAHRLNVGAENGAQHREGTALALSDALNVETPAVGQREHGLAQRGREPEVQPRGLEQRQLARVGDQHASVGGVVVKLRAPVHQVADDVVLWDGAGGVPKVVVAPIDEPLVAWLHQSPPLAVRFWRYSRRPPRPG